MNIRDRMKRMENEDIIYIGRIVEEHLLNTELLDVVECMTQDRNMEELNYGKNGVSADRVLGRIEMGSRLIVDLKNLAISKETATRPIKRRRRGKATPLAEDPHIPDESVKMGGTV